MDVKQLRDLADELFGKKLTLNSLHQEIADNFYVERADFTFQRSLGQDFGAHLMSSFPLTCRRELGNQFSTMLRPTARPWFHTARRYVKKDDEDTEVRAWLEWFEQTQRRAMYDVSALFNRATKEADHDFAAFGQTVLSVELNKLANGLLYRCWHLRDMAWQEDEEGKIGFVARKWKPTAQMLKRLFGDRNHQSLKEMADKSPFDTVDCYHLVVDADMYDDKANGRPRWSIYYDCTHQHLIHATPIWGRHYVIPRWQTVSGSQYAYSPAAVCALPDARLLQAMTFTLLEAGEKATNPPMVAVQNVVKSDVALYSGGITWVDEEYDERLGAALRPIEQDLRGFQNGVLLNQDTRQMLSRAFFLDALTPFSRGDKDETAYEVGQRVQKYIRDALPIFEPMEQEYNAALCDESFELMWRAGGFGNPDSWPRKLRGAEIEFQFESPLHDLIEQQKGSLFQESLALVGAAIPLDPAAAAVPKVSTMLREALLGVGAPANWLNTEAEVERAAQGMAEDAAQQQQLAAIEQASSAVKNIGQSGLAERAGL
jgi:hypothetical protein